MDDDENDDCECEPTEAQEEVKKVCPKTEYRCPPRDIDPCALEDRPNKKTKRKGRADDCEEEKTCANVPAVPDQRERLMREHLELCKAAKQPTCRETAAKKSKDPC